MRANRPRINQPTGFHSSGGYRPTYYYGMNHDYVFFPVAWTDDATGTYYEKGYYDENGQRYDSVAFANNGRYENVVCHCAYCGQDTIMNPSSAEISAKKLDCPNCGAPMEIRSALDQYQNIGNAGAATSAVPVRSGRKRTLGIVLLAIILIFAGLIALGSYEIHKEARLEMQETQEQPIDSFQLTGGNEDIEELLLQDTIYLSGSDEFGYTLSSTPADKELVWDDEAESFYDEDSDCWLWYNTDVEPPVWQYWYEGISSDFGDYGWMEHDADGWFIEASYGNWIRLPEEYDTDSLWYMEE